jgi:capsular exopolysaccharide synthesis family protein
MQNGAQPSDLPFWKEDEEGFDLRNFLLKYLRYWYWFALSITLCCTAAYFYLQYTTPIYEVKAVLLIKDEEKGMSSSSDILAELDIAGGNKLVENEIEVLHSRTVIGKVVDKLNLSVSYWKEGRMRDVELFDNVPIKVSISDYSELSYNSPFYIIPIDSLKYEILDTDRKLLGSFDYGQAVRTPYGKFRVFTPDLGTMITTQEIIMIKLVNRESVISSIIGGLTTELANQKSTVISLSIKNAVPEKGEAILASILEEYAFLSLQDKNREATNTLRFIEDRLSLVTSELGNVEQDVEQYRTSRGITDLSTEANLFLERAKDNDAKLNEVDIQLKVLDGVDRYLQSNQVGNVAPATLMVNDVVLTGYLKQLSELELERGKMAQTTQSGNPFLETINSQMKNIKGAIRENVSNQKNGLLITKNSLSTFNKRLETAISTIPRKEREYVEIKRQAGIKESLYLLLLRKREETALSYASTVTDSRIVDVPFSGGSPVSPKNKSVALVGLLLGLIIPVAAINIKDLLTNTVQSKKEIEAKTGLKVFGEIGKKETNDQSKILDLSSRSFVSEQVRMIRSNMQYLFANSTSEKGKVILVTSSTAGEGKSFVTVNIAASLGLLDKKIIILELDLRKPNIKEYLNVPNKTGITNYLIGKADEKDIIHKTDIRNVFLSPSGPIPPNPSELIANGRLEGLLEALKHNFDYIFIDTPPVNLVTDAVLMAGMVDSCFYLIRHEKTPKQFLSNIKELKDKKVFPSINLIFNAVNYKNSSDYGYGYYGEEKNVNNLSTFAKNMKLKKW